MLGLQVLLLVTTLREVVVVRLLVPVLLEGLHARPRQQHIPVTDGLTDWEALG